MEEILLSIAIPTFNRVKSLDQLLSTLLLIESKEFLVVVSDNYSADNTKDVCARFSSTYQNFMYFCNSRNIGFDLNIRRCFEIAKDKKFCDFIKDDADRTFQIIDPFFVSKQRILLSWFIKKILSSKTLMLDFIGIP